MQYVSTTPSTSLVSKTGCGPKTSSRALASFPFPLVSRATRVISMPPSRSVAASGSLCRGGTMDVVSEPVSSRSPACARSSSQATVSEEASPHITWEYVCVQSS